MFSLLVSLSVFITPGVHTLAMSEATPLLRTVGAADDATTALPPVSGPTDSEASPSAAEEVDVAEKSAVEELTSKVLHAQRAQIEKPAENNRHRLVYDTLTVGRGNPIGLATFLFAGYRYRLFESESILWRPAFLQIGPQVLLTPDVLEGGIAATVKPIAVLTLEARYMFALHSPFLQSFDSFKTKYADYGPSHRVALDESHDGYSTAGGFLKLRALFEFQLGPFALQNELEIHRQDVTLRDGDRVFYYSRWDALFPNHGWGVANHINAIAFSGFGLLGGFRYVVTKPFHENQWFSGQDIQQRVGFLWGYQFMKRTTGMVREILGIGSAQWWIQHPYRVSQEVPQFVPYVIMALTVKGDYPL